MINNQDKLVKLIEKERLVKLTRELIKFKTINPPGNERDCAEFIADNMRKLGLDVALKEESKNRTNCIVTLKGSEQKPTLIYNGHIDVVPPGEGWSIDPFEGFVSNDKIHGRGASDMKSGIAAMMCAIEALVKADVKLRGNLIFTAVADEECLGPFGTDYLIREGLRGDMAIVGESTGLKIEIAERGILWTEITTIGRSAHGGRPWLGINAIYSMNKLITSLINWERQVLSKRTHPLVKSPTFNVGMIYGGEKINIVPSKCIIQLDRRLIPGESFESALKELNEIVEGLKKEDPNFQASIRVIGHANPYEISPNEPIVKAIERALISLNQQPELKGKDATTDGHILVNKAHIPTAIFGPGDESLAHTNYEYVEINKILIASKVYAIVALDILG